MAENEDTFRSRTTPRTATETCTSPQPPPTASPLSPRDQHSGSQPAIMGLKGDIADLQSVQSGLLQLSPMCNGYGSSSSPQNSREDGPTKTGPQGETHTEGGREAVASNGSPPTADRKVKEESQQTAAVKQETDQDGPLDFSLRRRDSVSESFTDDSRASSSLSPPSYGPGSGTGHIYSSPSLSRHSPEPEHLPLQQPALHHLPRHLHPSQGHPFPLPHQYSGGGGHGKDASDHLHKLPHLGKSPGSSPDHSDLIGQPKTAPKVPLGNAGPRSPINSSLVALGMMAEGGGGSGMTPAAMASMLGQNGGMLGSLGNLSTFMGDPRKMMGSNGGKIQRPFKAYPKEALQMPLGYLALPGMNPFPSLDHGTLQGLSMNQDDMMSMYKQQLDFLKEREKQMVHMSKMNSRSPPSSSAMATTSSSSFCTSNNNNNNNSNSSMTHPLPLSRSQAPISHSHAAAPPSLPTSAAAVAAAAAAASSYFPPSSHSSSSSTPSLPALHSQAPFNPLPTSTPISSPFPTPTVPPLVSSTSSITGRKRPRSLPDNQKDDAYWERRRKNNDAAKRSRDARRAKEDEIAIRAALLEQENLKLRVEVAALKTETARLRCLLYNS